MRIPQDGFRFDEIRRMFALSLASKAVRWAIAPRGDIITVTDTPEEVVRRAELYERFIKGKQESHTLPPPPPMR